MIVEERKTQSVSETTSVFRRILVPVDFSYASRRALAVATALAPADAKLSVAHVMNTDWRYEMLENPPEIDLERHDAKDKLSALVGEFNGDRKIDSLLVRHGPIAQAILALAGEEAADLIVVGTHGRGGLSKLALGSVAEELLRISPNPVMTVGPKAELTPGLPLFQTILFATDFGKGSTTALPLVLAMAAHYKAKLILMHMTSPMPASSDSLTAYAPASAAAEELQGWEASSRNRSLLELKKWLPRETGLPEDPEYIVGTEFLSEAILEVARKRNIDLIVMGANRTAAARFAAHIPWTAVHEVVCDAPCPVMTVAG
jgi:nucleotide-binding universal stress UspA family protein